MDATFRRRLPAAGFVLACLLLPLAWAAPCSAADGSSPLPAQADQLMNKVLQLQQFLQELRQERESRPPLDRLRDAIGSIDELEDLWNRIWDDLRSLCQQGSLDDELSNLGGGQVGLPGLDGLDGSGDAQDF